MNRANAIIAALAPAFNRLLNIQVWHFGRTTKASEPSPANIRAQDLVRRRYAAHCNRISGKPYEAGL